MRDKLREINSSEETSIFFDDLPIVSTNESVEKVKFNYSKYDPYYIVSGCLRDRRDKFNQLWLKYRPYADSHFLSQVRINFHQRSWEMYIGNVFLEKGLSIKSSNEGPDFIIDKIAYIECVAPTKGDVKKPDSVPEMFIANTPEEIIVQDVPVDKMILRITQAIKDKAIVQYSNWKSKKWFDSKMPFIIAVNTGDLGHVENPGMPNVLKALFGFQFLQINLKTGNKNYSHREIIEKNGKILVPVNFFANPDFNFVSGILFSDKTVLNHPEKIGDDCIFVNNPFTKNLVNDSFTGLFQKWIANKDKDNITLTKDY